MQEALRRRARDTTTMSFYVINSPATGLDWSESNREDITVELHILLLKHFKDRKIKTILNKKHIY